MVTTSRKLFLFPILDGGCQRKEPFFSLQPRMTKFYPKWLVDYFVMPTCASINPPLLQLERHQHRITFHHLPTFHDERDDERKGSDSSCQRLKSPKNDFHHHRSLPLLKRKKWMEEMDGRIGWKKWKVKRAEDRSGKRKMSKATSFIKSFTFLFQELHFLINSLIPIDDDAVLTFARLKRDFTFFFRFLCFNCYFRLPACSTSSISPTHSPLDESLHERYDE